MAESIQGGPEGDPLVRALWVDAGVLQERVDVSSGQVLAIGPVVVVGRRLRPSAQAQYVAIAKLWAAGSPEKCCTVYRLLKAIQLYGVHRQFVVGVAVAKVTITSDDTFEGEPYGLILTPLVEGVFVRPEAGLEVMRLVAPVAVVALAAAGAQPPAQRRG